MVPQKGTHTRTDTQTNWLIESIGPEGQCFENMWTGKKNAKKIANLLKSHKRGKMNKFPHKKPKDVRNLNNTYKKNEVLTRLYLRDTHFTRPLVVWSHIVEPLQRSSTQVIASKTWSSFNSFNNKKSKKGEKIKIGKVLIFCTKAFSKVL